MSRAKEYKAAISQIQSYSYLGILAGLAAVVLGFQGNSWLNGALAVGGGVLILDCVWVIRSPLSAGVRPLGAALFVVGLYFLARPNMSIGTLWGTMACMAGAWHVLVDYRRLTRGDLAGALTTPPTPQQLAADQLDDVVDNVRSSTMASDPNRVEFSTADFFSWSTWQGRLRKKDAILSFKRDIDGMLYRTVTASPRFEVVPKANLEITPGRKRLFRASFKAKFYLGDRQLKGVITKESLDRYTRWKTSS